MAAPAIESTVLMDGNRVDMWYEAGGNLKYAYTTDPGLQVWTVDGVTILTPCYYPAVAQHPVNGLWYMTCCNHQLTGDVYMYSSPDKTTWTIINGGSPVLAKNGIAGTWGAELVNTSLIFVGDTIYFMVEAGEGSNTNWRLGVATSTLAAGPDFSVNLTKVIDIYSVTPDIHYLPAKHEFLIFGCISSPLAVVAWHVAADDLFDPTAWRRLNGFEFSHTGLHTGDPSVVELSSYFSQKLLMSYNYDQHATGTDGIQPNSLRQAFCGLDLNEFHEALLG